MMNKLFVVIPAHNESERILDVINKVKKYTNNIIVVDDGSTDNTFNIVTNLNVKLLKHIVNLGKGSALRTGCDYAIKLGAEQIIVLDADGQHKPEDIPMFIKALEGYDIVFGSRTMNNNMPLILKMGNKFISLLILFLYNVKLFDTQSGYRAFTNNAYKKIRWNANDYSMESEMIANVGKYKLKYNEIIIDTIYHDKYKGTTAIDGVKVVSNLLWWKLIR